MPALGITWDSASVEEPQHLIIQDDPKTLLDLHQLCGSISRVHPLLGAMTEDLTPLFNLLKGSEDLDSPHAITAEAQESIGKVQHALSSQQAHQILPHLPFNFIILGDTPRFYGFIFQWDAA